MNKSETKFQPGDKVVCIDAEIRGAYDGVYTVIKDYEENEVRFVETKEEGNFLRQWMELESVYNSPLSKALR